MISPLIETLMQYAGPAAICFIVGIALKMYLNSKMQEKVKDYQGEIVRSHSRILMLEEKNGKLEKKLQEFEKSFTNERLIMN